MGFDEALNSYIQQIGITGKDLADASGLSAAVISRYRSGERTPAPDGQSLARLARGLSSLAQGKGLAGFGQSEVLLALQKSLGYEEKGEDRLALNLDLLMDVLRLRSSDMAHALNFDPSYLSRIRTGQRAPANPAAFAQSVGNFVTRRCAEASERAVLAQLMGVQPEAVSEDGVCACEVAGWLLNGATSQDDPVLSFLEKLDSFDLNDYIRTIRFDEWKVPTVPFQLPTARTCYGLENFRQTTLDFLRATALSRSHAPVFICSDMPIQELAQDLDFSKKWMMGLAAILKKGLCLDMVHELNRPFGEMMLGLESWIPLYMTGQITPWYLPGRQNTIYGHLLFCSGAAAVEGECISGDFSHGRYLFSKSASDLAYYRRRADGILKKARPLMDIYSEASEKAYGSFLAAEVCKEGARRGVLTALPLHTLSEEHLRLTRAFAQSHPGYTAREGSRSPFRDIQIFISKGKWVSISKCRKPSIHFVIHHPKLCGAIENMILPLEERGTG